MTRTRGRLRRSEPHREHSATAEARVELATELLEEPDVALCAQAVLRWLGRHTPAEESLCAVVDQDRKLLVGIAGDGVPHARVAGFALSLASRSDPLVIALSGSESVHFVPREGDEWSNYPATPLGRVPFHVVPLDHHEAGDSLALGLLLVSGFDGAVGEEVRWAAGLLGTRLLCARYGEARAAERRAQRERLLLSRVIDSVTDPIILTDMEGRMLFANAQAETLLSVDDESSEGRRRAVALNNMLFSASLFTATEHGGPARRELLLVDPTEGQDLLFELLSTEIRDKDHDVGGIVSILRDVGDLRTATQEIEVNYAKLRVAEAEVRAERDRLDLIINAVADPVLVTDPMGNIVLMNPPAERLFTLQGTGTVASRRQVQANDVVFSSFVSNLYTMQALRWREQIELADPISGNPLPVEAIAAKVISKGEIAGVVTILHDRSEAIEKARLYEQVKRHSDELREKIQEATLELSQQNALLREQALALEQASEAKSHFLANVSHELRTPLNAILGYSNLFLEGILGVLEPLQREKVERIDANARHLVSLINDLLDLTRADSGRMPVHVQGFQVAELVAEVMKELEPLTARSRLPIICEAPPWIPTVASDRQKLKQILLNLLSNAIKFTPEGMVRVHCAFDEPEDLVSIGVSDTGIGIPHEQQEQVFEEFRQVDSSSTRQYGGTGLGLAISRRLARLIRGEIGLVSSPGAGSTFTIVFPRRLQ